MRDRNVPRPKRLRPKSPVPTNRELLQLVTSHEVQPVTARADKSALREISSIVRHINITSAQLNAGLHGQY